MDFGEVNLFNLKGFKIPKIPRNPGSDANLIEMSKPKTYFDPADLAKFGNITEFQAVMGKKWFDYYGEVMKEGALTEREKALIALAVAHATQCPYCIDAYSQTCLEKGADEEQMMEAVHVAAAIKSGTTLVYSVQMMNHVKKLTM